MVGVDWGEFVKRGLSLREAKNDRRITAPLDGMDLSFRPTIVPVRGGLEAYLSTPGRFEVAAGREYNHNSAYLRRGYLLRLRISIHAQRLRKEYASGRSETPSVLDSTVAVIWVQPFQRTQNSLNESPSL